MNRVIKNRHFLPGLLWFGLIFLPCSLFAQSRAGSIIDSLRTIYPEREALVSKVISVANTDLLHDRLETADALTQFAIENTPVSARSQYAFARVQARLGRLDEGIAAFHQVIESDPHFVDAYGSLAISYRFKGETQKARELVNAWLASTDPVILREAHAIAAALEIYAEHWDKAIDHLKQRVKITRVIGDVTKSVVDHTYWDNHLIGNILLDIGRYEEARAWYKKATKDAESTLDPEGRPLRVVKANNQFFLSHYYIHKGELDSAQTLVAAGLESNRNGLGSHLARILIKRNMADSALKVLDTYCRDGYYKQFLRGKAYLAMGKREEAGALFEEVLNFNQTGNRYWLHEYALTSRHAKITPSNELHPSWSPSGKHLVFYSNVSGNNELYTLDTEKGTRKQLTNNAAEDGNPVWSPTGEYITFHSDREGDFDIYIIRPDGTGLKRLTSNAEREMSPSWSPDGRSLVYEVDYKGNWQLFTIELETGKQKQLTSAKMDHLAAAWSSDGRKVYFGRSFRGKHQTDVELRALDLQTGALEDLTSESGVSSNAALAASGKTMVFNSHRDGNWEIYTMTLDGKNQRRLTNNSRQLPGFSYAHIDGQPALSPDGKKVAFLSGRAGSFDICVMNLKGKHFQNLTQTWFNRY